MIHSESGDRKSVFGNFREQIHAVNSIDGAVDVLTHALQELGFTRFIAGYLEGSAQDLWGSWRKYNYHTVNFPAGWEEAWYKYNPHCPYYHACFEGRAIFDWAAVRSQRNMTDMEKQAELYLADFGLIQGITVPIHSPHGSGFVTVIGEGNTRDWKRRAEMAATSLLFISHVYHEAVRNRFPSLLRVSEPNGQISARERECLRWAAAGKTTEEIGTILGLSQETVRVYIKRAMKKLGATSRTQAVACAYTAGVFAASGSGRQR